MLALLTPKKKKKGASKPCTTNPPSLCSIAFLTRLEYRAIQEPVRTIPGLEEYYQAKAQKLDLADRRVVCEDLFSKQTFRLTYDYLVIATGCKTSTFGTPGVKASEAQHHDDSDGHSSDVFFLKHLWHARRIRNRLIECFERASNPTLTEADQDRLCTFVVAGAGPTACEFTTELADFLRSDVSKWYPALAKRARIVLVDPGQHVMSSFDAKLAEYCTCFGQLGLRFLFCNCIVFILPACPAD